MIYAAAQSFSAALCARDGLIHYRETRAEEDDVYACRGISVRSYPRRGGRRPVQSRGRHYFDLELCSTIEYSSFGEGHFNLTEVSMSDLVVIVYPSEAKAEEVRQRLFKLQKEYLIT